MFKVGDYVVVCSPGNSAYPYNDYIFRVIGRRFISTRTQGEHWLVVESPAFDSTHHYKDSSLRAASDSEVLMFRLGVPHTLGKQQSIPATACSKAGSNVSVI
jgi:hypothetical protein